MLGILCCCFFNIFRSSLLMEIFHWLNISLDFRKPLSFSLSPHHPPFYLSPLHKVTFISHAQHFLYLLGFLFLSNLISWAIKYCTKSSTNISCLNKRISGPRISCATRFWSEAVEVGFNSILFLLQMFGCPPSLEL